MRGARELANALIGASAKRVRMDMPYAPQKAIVVSLSPFAAELIEHRLVMTDDDLSFGQWARKYDHDFGIELGDTVVLMPTESGDFLVADVISTKDTPGAVVGAQSFNEVPSGVMDGVNQVFTLAVPFVPGTLLVTYNGLVQKPGDDYSATPPTTLTLVMAPKSGTKLLVTYLHA